MPTSLEVVRPHDQRCRLCVEYDLDGNPVQTPGHYVCQHTTCDGLADYTWPKYTDNGTEPILACEEHTLPVQKRDKTHNADCPAPDPGCTCTWPE